MEKWNQSVCHCINLRRAANHITEYYDKIMAPAGLTVNQYSLLVHLEQAEESSVSQLAFHMGLERSTLARNLKPLMRAGLIQDKAGETARNRKLCMTQQGKETLKRAAPLWTQAQEKIEACIGTESLQVLFDMLFQLENLK